MSKSIDEIIDKHLHNILIETSINVTNDSVLNNAQKRIASHLKELIKNRDEKTIRLMKSMGYDINFDKDFIKQQRSRVFNGSWIEDELTNDIINVVKILKEKYPEYDSNCHVPLKRKRPF